MRKINTIKKNILFFSILIILFQVIEIKSQTIVYDYDIFDADYYDKEGKLQLIDFKYHRSIFPPKPLDKWEFSAGVGLLNILFGQVNSQITPLALTLSARKSLSYVVSLRGQYTFGIAKNRNYFPTYDYALDKTYNTQYSNDNAIEGVYRNARTTVNHISGDIIFNLSSYDFHKHKRKINYYAFIGPGIVLYSTEIDALDADENPYNFDGISSSNEISSSNSSTLNNQLDDLFDGDYETTADYGLGQSKLGNTPIALSISLGFGAQYKINDKFAVYAENKMTYAPGASMDGSYHGGPGSYMLNVFSIGVNFNHTFSKHKRTLPLWWINPLNYIYKELNEPRSIKIPEPTLQDSDEDGVADILDREPNTPLSVPIDARGVTQDTDGDGVPDFKDLELITPTICRPVDDNGVGTCPHPEQNNINLSPELIEQIKENVPCPCDNIKQKDNLDSCNVLENSEDAQKIKLSVNYIFFKYNSAELSPSGEAYITDIAKTIIQNSIPIIIYGKIYPYEEHSQTLSNNRAIFVRNLLLEKGVPEKNIHIVNIDPFISVTNIPLIDIYCPSLDHDNDNIPDIKDNTPYGTMSKEDPEFQLMSKVTSDVIENLKELSDSLTHISNPDKEINIIDKLSKLMSNNPDLNILISYPSIHNKTTPIHIADSIAIRQGSNLQDALINKGVPKDKINMNIISPQQSTQSIPIIRPTNKKLDTDKDGVIDIEDKCPTIPGLKANQGCPYSTKEYTTLKMIGKTILFEFDSDKINPSSYPLLDTMYAFMQKNSRSTISIIGNTDNKGSDEYNKDLSKRRAESIKKYLIQKGIVPHRLNTLGMGATNPIASNTTAEGRAENRRVEFWVNMK